MKIGATNGLLNAEEIKRYHSQGYLGPYELCTQTEMEILRLRIEREVLTVESPPSGHYSYSRHHDSRLVYDLCAHDSIIKRYTALFGPDIALWNSGFWIKTPGDPPIPWHQDLQYWSIDPPLNFSAWISITHSNLKNGCLNIIPESHLRILPTAEASNSDLFEKMTDPDAFDETDQIALELDPGEFVLFNDRLLHCSQSNNSSEPRVGLVARYTLPFVELFQGRLPLSFEGHRSFIVSGEDRFGLNRVGSAPGD